MPQVKVLRPFNEHHNGGLVHPGQTITVTDLQRDELKRLGLAQDAPNAKAAAVTENKMAEPVANKDAAPVVVTKVKRGRGRPARVN